MPSAGGRCAAEMRKLTKPLAECKLMVFSHKEVWRSSASPSGWATDGGFAYHMLALSSIFGETEVLVPQRPARTAGENFIKGHNLSVTPLSIPAGHGAKRKITTLLWFLAHLPYLLKKIRSADVLHFPLPSDVGFVALHLALRLKKPIFIRHCGNWLDAKTSTEKYMRRLFDKHAGKALEVMATGGGSENPSAANPSISWIFSSSLSQADLAGMQNCAEKKPADGFIIARLGRQEKSKGTDAVLQAVALLQHLPVKAIIMGDGAHLPALKALAAKLNIGHLVEFMGYTSHGHAMDVLCKAHFFAFPSHTEGFPKAVLEAMAAGCVPITSGVSVLPQLVGDAGTIVPINDPQAIAQAIEGYMTDENQRIAVSRAAQAKAMRFTLEGWADTIRKKLEAAWL